ncbi:MAG TPA: hypothetical protein P5102_15260 [Candidatus Competibacteraceae bacterium]|nr:hypothetical protein [Candidatus Competibacteraceae bacterium]HRZ07472.1 hypothetical protein [Candidatus Competibacteraceae bacterium]HSA47835.1 hypothetical protein [Candidatus Competibacteraceae bacterium]
MTTTTQIHVLYDGPALAHHEMDVHELAPALMAIGTVFDEANALFNGERAKIQIRVKGSFKTGSFGIEFSILQSIADQLLGFLQSNPVVSAATMVTLVGLSAKDAGKGLIGLLRWLRGRSITKVVLLEDHRVRVEVGDEHLEVERRVIDLYRNYKLRKAFEEVLKPLEQPGIDSFAVTDERLDNGQSFLLVEKHEQPFFKAPEASDEQIENTEFDINLQAVNIAFQDDNKWRFTDGNSTFHAAIQDADFLAKIAQNEVVFAKGDVLRVRMRKQQWLTGEKMRTVYEVLKVLEHRSAARQLPLHIEDHRRQEE